MTTHYLITNAKQAIAVTATDVEDAMDQAHKMGVAGIVTRVDVAMTEEEWNAATAVHEFECKAARVSLDTKYYGMISIEVFNDDVYVEYVIDGDVIAFETAGGTDESKAAAFAYLDQAGEIA